MGATDPAHRETRLSGTDAAFLAFEEPSRPMVIGALAMFDRTDPRLDAARIVRGVADLLGTIPRFRQRPKPERPPAWVDDPGFDVRRHMQHLRLRLGSEDPAFARRVGRLLSEPLPEGRPLWKVRLVTGLDDDRRFALVLTIHHALLDGAAGVGLLGQLLGTSAQASAMRRSRRASPNRARSPVRRAFTLASSLLVLLRKLRPTSRTALNGEASARRDLAWLSLDEGRLLTIARRAAVSPNDVLLALVAGALRRWLEREGERPERLRIRALCPVDGGRSDGDDALGNRLGAWVVDLPVQPADPALRLRRVRAATQRARRSGHAAAVQWLGRLSRLLPAGFPRLVMRLAGRLRAANLTVTQPPRLRGDFELLGCPLVSLTPFAPLFHGQRCSVAALRQRGVVRLGINGGWGSEEPTLRLAQALRDEFEAMAQQAHQPPDSQAA